ncbi:MAG: transcriptional regulator [Thermoleophilia bacterium]|nr:transcriptional regulator [Thermoleophilia bacterium]
MSDDELADQIERFFSVHARIDTIARQELRITPSERMALLHLSSGITSPTDLSRHLGMTSAGVTNLLDRLVESGHVTRARHKDDGRRILVLLTKRGIQAHLRLHTVASELAAVANAMGDDGTACVVDFLDRATAVLHDRREADERLARR